MISKRLKEAAKYIYPFKRIADVGCDHGYLIIHAFEEYKINYAVAIDNKTGPLEFATKNIKDHGYDHLTKFSLSSGISDIEISEVDVVIIAGMGGSLIIKILKSDLEKLVYIKRFILVPQRDIVLVRKFMYEHGFYIKNEEIVFENRKYYEVLVFENRNDDVNYDIHDFTFGPILRKERTDIFIKKWTIEYEKLKKIPRENNVMQKLIEREGIVNEN